MWKPPQRIKHSQLEARWPTAAEASGARLFSPLQMGSTRLEQRTWVPAMVPWRASGDGFVTQEILEWYERLARGRPGALVVEATGIRDIPSGPLLRIGHDRFVPGLRDLVRTVEGASGGHTRLLIQVIDFLVVRRRPAPEVFFDRYLEITDHHRAAAKWPRDDDAVRQFLRNLPDEALDEVLAPREAVSLRFGFRERVTDTERPTIEELPRVLPGLFADAARRARAARFDGIELHFAHAYTMASFLSALNTRTDGYGGSREQRIRVPLEVYRAVRSAVGDDFCVGCRYLSEDCIEGGSSIEDAVFFGVEFAAAGMDFLSLSRGGKFEDAKQPKIGWAVYPYTGPSGYECMPTAISDESGPFGRNVPATARIRAAIRREGLSTPVIVAGGISTFEQAERILSSNQADAVAAARQSLADPDWFRKILTGRGDEIRRCVYSNYCEGLDQKHKQVTCQLWDRERLDDPGVSFSLDGKRRLVAPDWTNRESRDRSTEPTQG